MVTYDIKVDTNKNRCIIIASGFFQDSEAKELADKYTEAIKKLKPGFDQIALLNDLKPSTPGAVDELQRIQISAIQHGINRLVRVFGESAPLTQMQVERQAKETGIKAMTARTLEEAEKLLDAK